MKNSNIHIPKDTKEIVISDIEIPKATVYHYYHFIADFVFPLIEIMTNNPHINSKDFSVKFLRTWDQFRVFEKCFLLDILKKLFNFQIEFISEEKSEYQKIRLRGYCFGPFPKNLIINVKEYILNHLKIQKTGADKIILIERGTDKFFSSINHDSGSDRRSIINHKELVNLLQEKYPRNFINIKLEGMDIADQVKLFSQAKILIGQHGAGLSHILWMENSTKNHVIEITPLKNLFCFKHICELKGLNYHRYGEYSTVRDFTTTINLNDFNKFLDEKLT